jgi:hypothetical protein
MTASDCVPSASRCVPDAVRPQCVHASHPLQGGRTRDAVRGDHTSASPLTEPHWLAGWMDSDDRRRAETMAAGKARLQQRRRA